MTPRGIYIGAGMIGLSGSMGRLLMRQIPELVKARFVTQKFTSVLAKLNQKDLTAIGALIAEGRVTPVIDRRYSLSEVPDAVRYLEQGHARGKVIIDVDHGD
jgi:NADPH:quinone reductase-like Zn-dependent oxidoreductase